MAAKRSMFEPEDTDILRDMYGEDTGKQADMFHTGHDSATGACSETFGIEADSPRLAKPARRRRTRGLAGEDAPRGAGAAARKSRGATALLLAGALLWLTYRGRFPLPLSILALCGAVLTAISRVIAGVHFPRDVLAGMLFGILFSAVGYGAVFGLFSMLLPLG